MPEPVNVKSVRYLASKFREWEAPFKEKGDPNGLWFGASATVLENAADELERLRTEASFRAIENDHSVHL